MLIFASGLQIESVMKSRQRPARQSADLAGSPQPGEKGRLRQLAFTQIFLKTLPKSPTGAYMQVYRKKKRGTWLTYRQLLYVFLWGVFLGFLLGSLN